MTSAESLQAHDRCDRLSFLRKSWERNILHPHDILRRSIEAGLESEDGDCGQSAGDESMTLCTERGIDIKQADQYGAALHGSALADLVAWVVRGQNGPWIHPEDVRAGKEPWISGAFLEASGTRLRRVVAVERWSDERALAESHAWYNIGEVAIYQIPLILVVIVLGQRRDARWHGPWSRAWTHPVNSALRMRKRSGEGFSGKWRPIWREETDYSRELWLDTMTNDGILGDVIFEVEIPVPGEQSLSKIRHLAESKLAEIRKTVELPSPHPSVCDWPIPCSYRDACWNFETPSTRNGFIQVSL